MRLQFLDDIVIKKKMFSVELALKPGRQESIVNIQKGNIEWTVLQGNRRITSEKMAASTSIS